MNSPNLHPRRDDQPDNATAERMRTAVIHSARVLGTTLDQGAPEFWGWRGRTIGCRAHSTSYGRTWLRVAASPRTQIARLYWTGNADAQHLLPDIIPRPPMLAIHDWNHADWSYRAELHRHIRDSPLADTSVIRTAPGPAPTWWAQLRTTLDILAAAPTDRIAVQPGFLAWATPRYLGHLLDCGPTTEWTTAHGDLHFANLCGPTLTILDWEGWGRAPAGYDAATLHCRSLAAPAVAGRIRTELADILDTPAGRTAELVVITELLHAADTTGAHPELVEPLKHRAGDLQSRLRSIRRQSHAR